jgi:hypothetical protein
MRHPLAAVGLLSLAACAAFYPHKLALTEAGSGVTAAPRPTGCRVEFHRTKAPERAYDELATMHFTATYAASAVEAQEMMRAKACELGADAVIVTRDYIGGVMTGTAVSYPELREGHRVEYAVRAARIRAEFEKGVEGLGRPPNLPPGYVPARARRDTTLRVMAGGEPTAGIAAGQFLWVEPGARAFRRAVVGDGHSGYVEEEALEFAPAEPKAAPPAAKPATSEHTNI